MSLCYIQDRDFVRAYPTTRQQVSVAASVVRDQADTLFALAQQLQTNDDAMFLYNLAAGLRDKLTLVVDVALEQADVLTGAVVGEITPELPFGVNR